MFGQKGQKQEEKNSPAGYLLSAVSLVVSGLCFIIFSSQAIAVMCYLLGGLTLLAAAFNAAVALAGKRRGVKFWLKMALCILALLCGTVVIVSKENALEYIVGGAAFFVVIFVSFRLQTFVRGGYVRGALWWTVIALMLACYAVAAVLLKFYLPAHARLMVCLFGGLLVLDGALNFLMLFLRPCGGERPRGGTESVQKTDGDGEKRGTDGGEDAGRR